MYYYFLLEDMSGECLVRQVMEKFSSVHQDVYYDCKSFKGIGGFTKKNTVKETRDGKLLNDLATYLRGFNKSLQNMDAAVFVVVDNDERNPLEFRNQLEQLARENLIVINHVFCIAIEEMEAWLLGDENALLNAYPQAKLSAKRSYVQDSICGTWEILADVVYRGGYTKMIKDCPSFREIGKVKAEWATQIGQHMDLRANISPSFNYFIQELEAKLA